MNAESLFLLTVILLLTVAALIAAASLHQGYRPGPVCRHSRRDRDCVRSMRGRRRGNWSRRFHMEGSR